MERSGSTPALFCRSSTAPKNSTAAPVFILPRRSKTHQVDLDTVSKDKQIRASLSERTRSTCAETRSTFECDSQERTRAWASPTDERCVGPPMERWSRNSYKSNLTSLNSSDGDDSCGLLSPEIPTASVARRRPLEMALNDRRSPFVNFRLPAIDSPPQGHRLPTIGSADEVPFGATFSETTGRRKSRRARTEHAEQVEKQVEKQERRSGRRVKTVKVVSVRDEEEEAAGSSVEARRRASSSVEEDLRNRRPSSPDEGVNEGNIDYFAARKTRRNKTWSAPKALGISISELSTPSSVAGESPLVSSPDSVSTPASTPASRVSPGSAGSASARGLERVSPGGASGESRISPKGACGSPGTGILRRSKCFKAGPPTGTLGWRKGAAIGRGTYGAVYRALEEGTGRIFAVKQAHVGDNGDDNKLLERLQVELKIYQTLRHPNIVSYLGHDFQDGTVYIHLEYVAGGSIADMLRGFGPIVGQSLKKAVKGSLEGLNYLHTQNPTVVHRDIKGANVLVDLNFNTKLADFGCSKRSDVTQSFTTIGSIPWMAPEVILQQNGYGRKADVWSFGCLVIEMASAHQPWGTAFDNVMAAMAKIGLSKSVPEMPEGASQECCAFIRRCVVRSPEERPHTGQLRKDDWLAA